MLALNRNRHQKGLIKIGCSKAACYWCHQYILELNEEFPRNQIVNFATHGKRTKGWILPELEVKAKRAMLNLIGTSIEDVFRAAGGLPRKKSDSRSLPTSSPGSSPVEEMIGGALDTMDEDLSPGFRI